MAHKRHTRTPRLTNDIEEHYELDVVSELPYFTVLVDEDATIAHVRMEIFDSVYEATGSAEKHPKDYYDRDTGIALATARAMRRLANQIDLEATHRTKVQDYRRSIF